MIDKYGREFVEEMKEKQRTVIKRIDRSTTTPADYDAFILQAKSEIYFYKKKLY